MLSRRRFLQTSSLLSLSPMLPSLFAGTARAAAAGPDERVLVVIQLDGGNDGLNTVVPYADDGYGRARDKLRIKTAELHKLDDHVGLHPRMQAAKELFDDARLSIVQNVGYPNPDRSHFRSMGIWQSAHFNADPRAGYGWLGSALDGQASKQGAGGGPHAIYIGQPQTPLALWGRRSTAATLSKAEDLECEFDSKAARSLAAASRVAASPAAATPASSLEQFVSAQTLSAYAVADDFRRQRLAEPEGTQSNYPYTSLGANLKLVSQLLKSGANARVYYTVQSGYDTHAAQLFAHARLLDEFAGATKAFLDDLKAANLDDRVVVLAFSEFGRRVAENDSQGTDHGTAGPVFLAGAPVKGGLIGAPPDLTNLDGGDLKMQIDFRQVYAALLDGWLGVDSKVILGESFNKLDILSA